MLDVFGLDPERNIGQNFPTMLLNIMGRKLGEERNGIGLLEKPSHP